MSLLNFTSPSSAPIVSGFIATDLYCQNASTDGRYLDDLRKKFSVNLSLNNQQESKKNSRRSNNGESNFDYFSEMLPPKRYSTDDADCDSSINSKINKGPSSSCQTLVVVPIIPMAVWKSLLAEIKKYPEKDLAANLHRALETFRTILKNKDIYELDSSDLDKLKDEFPLIVILKSIDQTQFVIGSDKLMENFNNSIFELIYYGAWGEAIEYIFRYHHMMAKCINVDVRERAQMSARQIKSVKTLRNGGILTDAEAKKLYVVFGGSVD